MAGTSSVFGATSKQGKDEFSQHITEADETGEKFVQLFMETMDKRRQLISGFYHDASVAVWNGNSVTGRANITSLYQTFPGTEHVIHCLDCHPVVQSQTERAVLVACQGEVKYDGDDNVRSFTQNFTLVKQGEVWKVASDCFRFLD